MITIRLLFYKKPIAIVLSIVMLLSLTACGSIKETSNTDKENADKISTFTVKDQAGRTVEINKNTQSVAVVFGLATNFILALAGVYNLVS